MHLSIIFEQLLATIFPRRETSKVLHTIVSLDPTPRSATTLAGVVTYLFDYRDPVTRALITEAKFHHNALAYKLLGAALRSYVLSLEPNLIIPIPLARRRARQRGYNQTVEILRAARVPYHEQILTRRYRPPQTSLDKAERQTNQIGVFHVPSSYVPSVTGATILLVDDVVTTGATLRAAKAALLPHSPATIHCVALAH